MYKRKLQVWDGLYVRNYKYIIKFITGDIAGETKEFNFRGHVGNCFEKLSWLVANKDMSIPKYEVVYEEISEPLYE